MSATDSVTPGPRRSSNWRRLWIGLATLGLVIVAVGLYLRPHLARRHAIIPETERLDERSKNEELWRAAKQGQAERVETLLAAGVDVDAETEYGVTALQFAAGRGHLDVVRVLLAHTTDVNKRDRFYGVPPLGWAAAIHLRRARSENLCRQVIESARSSEIDVLLLGGDLVDEPSEAAKLCDLVGGLCELAPVFAVGGNHDRHVGINRVRDAVEIGGGQWIHAGAASVQHGSRVIAVSGPEVASLPDGDFQVLCAHNPRVWKTARQRGYDLVLAGHLHGCQAVAFEYRDRLFPGAVFYPYCYLSHQQGSTRLVVSRGVSDLVPIRWRCPREVVLCHV